MSSDARNEAEPEAEPEVAELEPPRRRRRSRTALAAPPAAGEVDEAPPEVRRARRERLIGGVCGGLARRYGLDPGAVRALFTLAAFVGGAGIAAYLAALFLFPIEPRSWTAPRPEGTPRQDPALVWAGLGLIAASLGLLAWLDLYSFRVLTLDRGALWPAVLLGLAALALRGRAARTAGSGARAAFLSRPRRDRVVFGVCSGFGRHAGVDANLVRVAWLVIAVWSYGLAIAPYLALAALLPLDPREA